MELSLARSARSGAPRVRKFSYLCIHEYLGSDKIVLTYLRPPLHVRRGEISAVDRIAFRTFRDKRKRQQQQSHFFFRLNSNVFIDVDNRERARARDKRKRRPNLLKKNRFFHKDHNAPCFPPPPPIILHNRCLRFLLGRL